MVTSDILLIEVSHRVVVVLMSAAHNRPDLNAPIITYPEMNPDYLSVGLIEHFLCMRIRRWHQRGRRLVEDGSCQSVLTPGRGLLILFL